MSKEVEAHQSEQSELSVPQVPEWMSQQLPQNWLARAWLLFQQQTRNLNGRSPDFVDWLEADLATVLPVDEADKLAVVERETLLGKPEAHPIPAAIPTDGFKLQLATSINHRLLTAEEELFLGEQVQLGLLAEELEEETEKTSLNLRQAVIDGRAAVNDLVAYNQKLVLKFAKKEHQKWNDTLDLADFTSAGNEGLLRAAKKYDHQSGYRFSTYASYWIMQKTSRFGQDQSRLIRLPNNANDLLNQILEVRRELQTEGREVSAGIIAEQTGIKKVRVEELLHYFDNIENVADLERPLSERGDTVLADIIEDPEATNPEEIVADQLLAEQLDTLLTEVLTPRQRQIIIMRFGLDGQGARTLEEVGQEVGVTRERIRQIELQAMRKLRMKRHLL